jgi:F-box domain
MSRKRSRSPSLENDTSSPKRQPTTGNDDVTPTPDGTVKRRIHYSSNALVGLYREHTEFERKHFQPFVRRCQNNSAPAGINSLIPTCADTIQLFGSQKIFAPFVRNMLLKPCIDVQASLFLNLPSDILLYIIEFLDARSKMALLLTCRYMMQVLANDNCWWMICRTLVFVFLNETRRNIVRAVNHSPLRFVVSEPDVWYLLLTLCDGGKTNTQKDVIIQMMKQYGVEGSTSQLRQVIAVSYFHLMNEKFIETLCTKIDWINMLSEIDAGCSTLLLPASPKTEQQLSVAARCFLILCDLIMAPAISLDVPNFAAIIKISAAVSVADDIAKQIVATTNYLKCTLTPPFFNQRILTKRKLAPLYIRQTVSTDDCSVYEGIFMQDMLRLFGSERGLSPPLLNAAERIRIMLESLNALAPHHYENQWKSSQHEGNGKLYTLAAHLICPLCTQKWDRVISGKDPSSDIRGVIYSGPCPHQFQSAQGEISPARKHRMTVPVTENGNWCEKTRSAHAAKRKEERKRILQNGIICSTAATLQLFQCLEFGTMVSISSFVVVTSVVRRCNSQPEKAYPLSVHVEDVSPLRCSIVEELLQCKYVLALVPPTFNIVSDKDLPTPYTEQ